MPPEMHIHIHNGEQAKSPALLGVMQKRLAGESVKPSAQLMKTMMKRMEAAKGPRDKTGVPFVRPLVEPR